MIKLLKSLDIATLNAPHGSTLWAFTTEDAGRNYTLYLGKRRVYISLLTEREQQDRKQERKAQAKANYLAIECPEKRGDAVQASREYLEGIMEAKPWNYREPDF